MNKIFGRLLAVAGGLTVLYAMNFMAVSLPYSDVVNIHLLNQRQNVLILGGILFLAGVFVAVMSRSENAKCPYCAEPIRKEAKVCKHCKNHIKEALTPDPVETTESGETVSIGETLSTRLRTWTWKDTSWAVRAFAIAISILPISAFFSLFAAIFFMWGGPLSSNSDVAALFVSILAATVITTCYFIQRKRVRTERLLGLGVICCVLYSAIEMLGRGDVSLTAIMSLALGLLSALILSRKEPETNSIK